MEGDETNLVHIIVESCRMRDGFRDFVREFHLLPNGIHRRVDLVDVPVDLIGIIEEQAPLVMSQFISSRDFLKYREETTEPRTSCRGYS